MTNQQHPITPPPALVEELQDLGNLDAIRLAYQAGADQELEACCQVLYARYDIPNCIAPRMAEDMREWLRAARRPKPPSLKGQALKVLLEADGADHQVPVLVLPIEDAVVIRRALEQLDD